MIRSSTRLLFAATMAVSGVANAADVTIDSLSNRIPWDQLVAAADTNGSAASTNVNSCT
jgi:hypothetical protein